MPRTDSNVSRVGPAETIFPPLSTARPAQFAIVMVFVSSVTAPFSASNRPCTVAPVVSVIEVSARIFPLNAEEAPNTAELPTCQKIWQA